MRFQLKNVGKIKDAEFELKSLTVFIGANGSGKTYAASALWSAITYLDKNIQFRLFNNFTNQILEFKSAEPLTKKIKKELKKLQDKNTVEVSLSFVEDEINIIYDFLIDFFKENLDSILTDTFKFNAFQNSQFIFQNQLNQLDIKINWTYNALIVNQNEPLDEKQLELMLSYYSNNNIDQKSLVHSGFSKLDTQDKNVLDDILIKLVYQIIFNQMYLEIFNIRDLLYIPAARTGLMFITHDIVQKEFEYSNNLLPINDERIQKDSDLTKPITDFIAKIHQTSRPFKIRKRARLREENKKPYFSQIMTGELVKREGQYRFDFKPHNLNHLVPLPASSSLVTELAALAALEENIRKGTFIILEEPEAHLHLSAQREMAKLIVRLINEKGCRILLTTHSDTFLQQINNLIMLEKLSHYNENALADFGIQAAEVIAAADVAVYDFQCAGNETRVENLVCGEYGFVAKSMNDVLIALADETQAIIGQIDDLED